MDKTSSLPNPNPSPQDRILPWQGVKVSFYCKADHLFPHFDKQKYRERRRGREGRMDKTSSLPNPNPSPPGRILPWQGVRVSFYCKGDHFQHLNSPKRRHSMQFSARTLYLSTRIHPSLTRCHSLPSKTMNREKISIVSGNNPLLIYVVD